MDHVLVVDDEPGIRGLLVSWAESLGCAVRSVGSAEEALEEAAREAVDIAFCDVNLPGRDGLWLARQLHQQSPDTAVVMSTGIPHLDGAISSLRLGVADYLLKPFGRERFRDALDRGRRWHLSAVEEARRRRAVELEWLTRRRQLLDSVLRLRLSDDESLLGLVGMFALRDRPFYGHATRVAALTGVVAEAMLVPAAEAADLRRAALIHEVPRTAIPETVLWKAGELTEYEWAVIRSQPRIGYEVFRESPFLAPAASLVLSMRERWDGKGYPEQLSGEAIPLGSRILSVCDAYDTMIQPLGHRDPMTPLEASKEILAARGTQFDARVADALLGIVSTTDPAGL